jgi:hypothetical protein
MGIKSKNVDMKLDIGCGKFKLEGYTGIDIDPESNADIIMILTTVCLSAIMRLTRFIVVIACCDLLSNFFRNLVLSPAIFSILQ